MATIKYGGYLWVQRQSEAEYRSWLCNEFSGVELTSSCNEDHHDGAYTKCSVDKQNAWDKLVKLVDSQPDAFGLCVTGRNIHRFMASFQTFNLETGVINRVFWVTEKNRYFAILDEEEV